MISVIIPVYNAEKYIKESVESIINQEYSNLEIIICDDASTDNSFEIIKSFTDQRITSFRNEKNIGYLLTVNKLFDKANGNFIAFQDADDVSHSKRFEVQLEHLRRYNLDLVGTNFKVISHTGKEIIANTRVEENQEVIEKMLITKNLFQKPSILFKKEILSEVGGYREKFLQLKNISEDYDWLLRIQEAGFRMGNVNYSEPLYLYRAVPTAMTKGFERVEQLFGAQVAQQLAIQRKNNKIDDLDAGRIDLIINFIETLKKPFIEDKSLFYREKAKSFMYNGMFKNAISMAFKSVTKEPLKLINWRTLQYCVRKSLLGI